MKNTFNLTLIFVLAIFFTGNLFGRDIKKDYHESFKVKPGDKLSLNHGDGNVFLSVWDKDIIDVEVRFSANIFGIGDNDYEFNVIFEQEGNTVEVREHIKPRHHIGIRRLSINQYKYIIQAPEYLILDIAGDDGDVNIEDIAGNINCRLSDGDVTIKNVNTKMIDLDLEDGSLTMKNIKAELDIKVDDGDININDFNGENCKIRINDGQIEMNRASANFNIRSDDGDIELRRISTSKLSATTNDGDIYIDLRQSKTPEIDIKTDDGKVVMDFDEDCSVRIEVETDDGRINANIDNPEYERKKRNHYVSEINGGKGYININTNDGAVVLHEER